MPQSPLLSERAVDRSRHQADRNDAGSEGKARRRRKGQKWTRWLHVYSSMVALMVVLFFSITGLTLNHPEWTFGIDPVAETVSGSLPDGAVDENGTVDFLVVSDYLRDQYGISGDVTDYGITGTEAYISYRGPGYKADAFLDTSTESYEVYVEQQGVIAVLNDLHKGRDTSSAWNWVIDVSAVFLILVSLTGLVLQLFLSKRRRPALTVAGLGALLAVGLMLVAVT